MSENIKEELDEGNFKEEEPTVCEEESMSPTHPHPHPHAQTTPAGRSRTVFGGDPERERAFREFVHAHRSEGVTWKRIAVLAGVSSSFLTDWRKRAGFRDPQSSSQRELGDDELLQAVSVILRRFPPGRCGVERVCASLLASECVASHERVRWAMDALEPSGVRERERERARRELVLALRQTRTGPAPRYNINNETRNNTNNSNNNNNSSSSSSSSNNNNNEYINDDDLNINNPTNNHDNNDHVVPFNGHHDQRNINQNDDEDGNINQNDDEDGNINQNDDIVNFVNYDNPPGPHHLWHVGTNRKLSPFGLVVHAGIDGFSRAVIYARCSDNNHAETALSAFLRGVQQHGCPSRVRSDRGRENMGIAEFVLETRGLHRDSMLVGEPAQNRRIARLWVDMQRDVLDYFFDLFTRWEGELQLDFSSPVVLFCLHQVFLPRINAELSQFVSMWNNHKMPVLRHMTPLQMLYLHKDSSAALDVGDPFGADGEPLFAMTREEGEEDEDDGVTLVLDPVVSPLMTEVQKETFRLFCSPIGLHERNVNDVYTRKFLKALEVCYTIINKRGAAGSN